MIPKKIHYIWFGKSKKPKDFEKIMASWKKFCPDYDIIEWNENNFDISKNYYCKKFYNKKLWAFASDYARIKILYDNGGIYLDTDMELLKNLDNLLKNKAFSSFQDIFTVGAGIIGAEKENLFIKEILDVYEKKKTRILIPNLMTKILKKYGLKKNSNIIQKFENITIYSKDYFYPYAFYENKNNKRITENTYAIHHFDASWLPNFITKLIFPILGKIIKILKI